MNVLLADASPLIRCGLKHLLLGSDDKATILEADSYVKAAEFQNQQLDLIWLDLRLPGIETFSRLQDLRDTFPEVPLAISSASLNNRRQVLQALEFGVQGIVIEKAPMHDILESLKRIKDGEIVIPKVLLSRTNERRQQLPASAGARKRAAHQIADLTMRQRQVLELLGHGKTNAQIAKTLGITEHTTRLHVSATLRALEVANRTQAALLISSAE